MKHYHLSLRRISKNYQNVHKRTQLATLAATLLLSFYEVWNSDHDKWCKHMWGARAIFRELPLVKKTQDMLALKRAMRSQGQPYGSQGYNNFTDDPASLFSMDDVDPGLVAHITGQPVVAFAGASEDGLDQGLRAGHNHTHSTPRPSTREYTERDVKDYESLTDLFWWFCKMDIYQSVLGGTRLL